MRYDLKKSFEKDFEKLPKHIQKKIKLFIDEIKQIELFDDIENNNLKQFNSSEDKIYFRLRIGNYRLGFFIMIDDEGKLLQLVAIKTRGEIYKSFPPSKKKRKH
jgi:mRNA-degrading endonuclease RelE of RelBE toxin-antitoxin system